MFGQVVPTKAAALVTADEMQTRHRGGGGQALAPLPETHLTPWVSSFIEIPFFIVTISISKLTSMPLH